MQLLIFGRHDNKDAEGVRVTPGAVAPTVIGANLARLRLDRGFSQQALAAASGVSRVALGKIERGSVEPRPATVAQLAEALGVSFRDLVTPFRPLRHVRFRTRGQAHGREPILARVSQWLDGFAGLERLLRDRRRFTFENLVGWSGTPVAAAREARVVAELPKGGPVPDICRTLEGNGVKLLLLETARDSFFGLSVGSDDGGPAVVVNTWSRISVERWIFTAAHELGHLLLHPAEYDRDEADLPVPAERQADIFASEFLMPDASFRQEWAATHGHPLLSRVLRVKRVFRVSYQTVLYRLILKKRAPNSVWGAFQSQYRSRFGRTLHRTEEPTPLQSSEFSWKWRRAGEPAALIEHDFVENRLSHLVRRARERDLISRDRAAEILGLGSDDIEAWEASW